MITIKRNTEALLQANREHGPEVPIQFTFCKVEYNHSVSMVLEKCEELSVPSGIVEHPGNPPPAHNIQSVSKVTQPRGMIDTSILVQMVNQSYNCSLM
jgi:hypothetical protein